MDHTPAAMDRHLDVIKLQAGGGLLVGASSLTGRYWLGSLWFYANPSAAPDIESCSAGVQLEAGLSDAVWINDNRMLVALDTGGIALWELQDECKTFSMLQSACEHDNITSSVSANADSSQFVSASHDRGIKTWDAHLVSQQTYRGHSDKVLDVQCHPSEPPLFLSCSQDGRVVLWDNRKSKAATVLGNTTAFAPTCLAWQPLAPKMFGTGYEGGQVDVRDLRMVVEKTQHSQPHSRAVTTLAFSPDRPSLLASTSEDCNVVITSLSSDSTAIYKSEGHSDYVTGSAWCERDRLLTCSWDGRIIQHQIHAMLPNGDADEKINGDHN